MLYWTSDPGVLDVRQCLRSFGVFIDKGYASEDHEGGIRALGEGVPDFTREELSVFSEEEWQKEKTRLIQKSWRPPPARRSDPATLIRGGNFASSSRKR